MKQRQSYHYQVAQEILPIKPLEPSSQIVQQSNVLVQPSSNKNIEKFIDEKSYQIHSSRHPEENIVYGVKQSSGNNSQDTKPLILRVKRFKKKLQSVLGNYQQPIQSSPRSVLKKDIMFPKLCEDKLKKKVPNISNLSIRVNERHNTPPLQSHKNQNKIMHQNISNVSSSIDQNFCMRNGEGIMNGKQEQENQNYALQNIINNKNDRLDMQLKQQNLLHYENGQGQPVKQKQPLDSYQQFNSIDIANNSFIQRNARAISQIEHNRRGSNTRSYQVDPVYQQSSKSRYQKAIPSQLSSRRESISIDYSQNQTPKQKQAYNSIRHYYPQTSKNTQISIDFEELVPYKNTHHNSNVVSPNSSNFQLNTLRSSKQSFILPPTNQHNQFSQFQNQSNIPIYNHLSARSARQSKSFGNGSVAICDSVSSSMQTIPYDDIESSQSKLRSIQVNIFQNQALQLKNNQLHTNQVQTNSNKPLLDSVELLKRRQRNHNKVSLDCQYLEDFSVFPEGVQQNHQPEINSSRSRQNQQSKNSGKRSGAGHSLPPTSVQNQNNNFENNIQRRSVISKISNNQTLRRSEMGSNEEIDKNYIWNKAQLTNNPSPKGENAPKVNQSLELQTFYPNTANTNMNTNMNTNINTIQSNKTTYDEEIKKITQLQQKNYHDLQNYVNIHLDLINIKTQIRIKSSLAGTNLKNNQV